jgi:hypothetical protein
LLLAEVCNALFAVGRPTCNLLLVCAAHSQQQGAAPKNGAAWLKLHSSDGKRICSNTRQAQKQEHWLHSISMHAQQTNKHKHTYCQVSWSRGYLLSRMTSKKHFLAVVLLLLVGG